MSFLPLTTRHQFLLLKVVSSQVFPGPGVVVSLVLVFSAWLVMLA